MIPDSVNLAENLLLVYEISVVVAGLAFLVFIIYRLRFEEEKRLKRVENLTQFVASEEPGIQPGVKRSRQKAVQSIETRFNIMRRLLIPLTFVFIAFLVVLPFLPRLPTTIITLLLTSSTILLGVVSKTYLENFVTGIVLSVTQPLRIGDFLLIDNQFGIVEEMNLTYIVIKLWDSTRYVIPNTIILSQKYISLTRTDTMQWAYVSFWVSHENNLEEVEEIATQVVERHPDHMSDRDPGFWIIESNKEGVVCWIAGWVRHPVKAWNLKHDLRKELGKAFAKNGIKSHTIYHHHWDPPMTSRQNLQGDASR